MKELIDVCPVFHSGVHFLQPCADGCLPSEQDLELFDFRSLLDRSNIAHLCMVSSVILLGLGLSIFHTGLGLAGFGLALGLYGYLLGAE